MPALRTGTGIERLHRAFERSGDEQVAVDGGPAGPTD